MQDFVLTVELKMSCIPDSEDFKKCVADGFANYCKRHPEEKVVPMYMHLKFDEYTLAHKDMLGNCKCEFVYDELHGRIVCKKCFRVLTAKEKRELVEFANALRRAEEAKDGDN